MKSGVKIMLDTSGLDALKRNLPDQIDAMNEKIAGDLVTYIHANFSRSAPNPSAPGEPPAVQTGTLKKSVTYKRVRKNTYNVVITAPYAKYLEYGTFKMQARPFMRPAVYAIAKKMPAAMKKAVESARGIGGGGLRTIVGAS